MYFSYSWPNSCTEWADIFKENPWVTRPGVTYAFKNQNFFLLKIRFFSLQKSIFPLKFFLLPKFDFKKFHGQRQALQLVIINLLRGQQILFPRLLQYNINIPVSPFLWFLSQMKWYNGLQLLHVGLSFKSQLIKIMKKI